MNDDLLDPLRSSPLPPLVSPAELRARGEQRTRRSRGALAGAAALVVVLGGVTFAVGQSPDELRPDPVASSAPDALPPALLLDADDIAAVVPGSWTAQDVATVALPPKTCLPVPASAGDSDSAFHTDGSRIVGQHVEVLADQAAGDARYWRLLAGLRACDRLEARYDITGPWDTERALVQPTADGREVRLAVERVGRTVVLIAVVDGTVEDLTRLADEAAQRAREFSPPAPRTDPAASSEWSLTDALLSPERASAVESPGWTVSRPAQRVQGPFADPCNDGTAPLPGSIVESVERTMLASRGVDGSGLDQEVYRYSSAATATDAFGEYAERFSRCAMSPKPGSGVTQSEILDRSGTRLVIRQIGCEEGQDPCSQIFPQYVFVVRAGDAVSAAGYVRGEHGDPRAEALVLAAAIEQRLRDVATR